MTGYLGKAIDTAQDGENNRIDFDAAYPVYRRLPAAIDEVRRLHGDEIYLLPMSGTSCGGGIFQMRKRPPGPVVGLRFDPPPLPRTGFDNADSLIDVELDEIRIDRQGQCINAGAAVTLEQLNQALAQELGHDYRVPGADLTSYQYAAAGATFMTGGMGPQRRYFSDSVTAIAVFDGEGLRQYEGETLRGFAGTYGWSGIVSALRCRYYRFPRNEVAFALPVKNDPGQLAGLLDRLAALTYLQLEDDRVRSNGSGENLILGIEHVSAGSMQPLLDYGSDESMRARAHELRRKCGEADADGLLFINALCDGYVDEFLLGLADDADAAEPVIAGIALEHAELFATADEMRNLREAVPYAARMQQPEARYLYKNHSDANIRIAPDRVAATVEKLWHITGEYVTAVEQEFAANASIDGAILRYGHLNPYGFDPHNRVTLCADDREAFERGREFLREARADYYRALAELCAAGGAEFIGGEKTADSEIAIFDALGGPENAPAELGSRFRQQQAAVRAAHPMFNWRALEPYI